MRGRIFHSDWDLGLDGLAVMDGDGEIGDSIGTTDTRFTTTAGTTRGAIHFTTETISTGEEGRGPANLTDAAESLAVRAERLTAPGERIGHSVEIRGQPEDTPRPASKSRGAPAREPSAATGAAGK